jgi:hypothetical protein
MVEFDPYVPETWLEKGVTVVVAPTMEFVSKPMKAARSMLRWTATAAIMGVGMALTDVPFAATDFGVASVVQVTEPAGLQYDGDADDVPAGHWNKLVSLLRSTPELPADDTSGDPLPLG